MDYPMIFALTPRAGRSNHRYLVPQGADWTEESLTRLAALAGKRDETIEEDCISVSRQVIQDATGRPARELLLIQDPCIKDAGQEMKQRLLELLRKHLIALEAIVTNRIDWKAVGNDLVVPVSDMNIWQSQVLTILKLEGTSLPQTKSPTIPTKPYRSAIVLVLFAIVAIPIGIWLRSEDGPNHQIPVPGRKSGERTSQLDSLVRVAKALGLPTSNATSDKLAQSISGKLELLFVASDPVSPVSSESPGTLPAPASSRATTRGRDPVDHIVSLLQDFYRYLYPNLEAPSQLEELAKDDGLMGPLTKLYSKHPSVFDSCGLLSQDEAKGFKLCGYPADQFHRIGACFTALSSIERGKDDHFLNSDYGRFLKDVADFDMSDVRSRSIEATRSMARFYTSRDVALAGKLEELLDKPSFRELLKNRNEQAGELPALFDLIGGQWSQATDRLLSEKALRSAKNDYPDANDDQAIDWLMKLVQACRSENKG